MKQGCLQSALCCCSHPDIEDQQKLCVLFWAKMTSHLIKTLLSIDRLVMPAKKDNIKLASTAMASG